MYEYRITESTSIFYCGKDLPRFLYARRDAGLLNITPALTENLESAIAALAPETTDVSETSEEQEDSTPKKKAPKKKAE